VLTKEANVELSNTTKILSGILLVSIPTVEFGGAFLLRMLKTSGHGYVDNPLRQNLFRAGHAHAGVLLLLSLVVQLFADALALPTAISLTARLGAPCAAILMPLGFFLCVPSPETEKPNGVIVLVYIGAVLLAISVLVLGVCLLRAL
jgi:Ni,Fe-hydrogenase I cytochrome b subunit